MTAKDLFRDGNLTAALEAATQEVKNAPGNNGARTLLFELLTFAGELDRADKQLEAIGKMDIKSEWPVQVYRNLIQAERRRRAVFEQGAQPGFLLDPPPFVAIHLQAIDRLRQGHAAAALELIEQAAEDEPQVRGQIGERDFEGLRDWDDLTGPVLEFQMLQDYIWIPWSQIRQLRVEPPERPRDYIWTPIKVQLTTDVSHSGYLPHLYYGTHQDGDDRVRLGRLAYTKAVDDGPVRGVGAHTVDAGGHDVGLLDCRQLTIAEE